MWKIKENKLIALDNIVQYLLHNGVLTDIECRKMVFTEEIMEVRATIFSIIKNKNLTAFKQILTTFRQNAHPLQNPMILGRIFSFLKYADIMKCRRVCKDWKGMVEYVVLAKYDDTNIDQLFLQKLIVMTKVISAKRRGKRLIEMPAKISRLMLAINPDMYESVYELLEFKSNFQVDVNGSSIVDCDVVADCSANLITKVLSNRTILNIIFENLSLEDIKICRSVCRILNAVAEPFVRNLSVVELNRSFGPSNFRRISKYFSLPDLPFTAFRFNRKCTTHAIIDFFYKFGKDVEILSLRKTNRIHPCLSQTVKLTEFIYQGELTRQRDSTDVMIPWERLHSIQVLRLSYTVVKVDFDAAKSHSKIIPRIIYLNDVRFHVDDTFPAEITFNTFVDFSKAKDVEIYGSYIQIQTFDWASETLSAESVAFSNTRFGNIAKSKSEVDSFKLYCRDPFSAKTYMNIKQLILKSGTIKLSALPSSLEKLAICNKLDTTIDIRPNFQLPNLKHLSFGMKEDDLHLLSSFNNCPNLTDLEIGRLLLHAFDIRWLPKTVKRLKLEFYSGIINIIGGDTKEHFDLDLLILGSVPPFCLKDLHFDKIRPKNLAFKICGDTFDDNAIVSFLKRMEIKRIKRMEKIYVFLNTSPSSEVFDDTTLSLLVDENSMCYEFSNKRGKAITIEEYSAIADSLGTSNELSDEDEDDTASEDNNETAESEGDDNETDDNEADYSGYDNNEADYSGYDDNEDVGDSEYDNDEYEDVDMSDN